MNITPEDLGKLRGLHPSKGFICILQSIKNGDFKGSNEYEYDADISIKIDSRTPEYMETRYKYNLTKCKKIATVTLQRTLQGV